MTDQEFITIINDPRSGLFSPYVVSDDDDTALKIAARISKEDGAILRGLYPVRGMTQYLFAMIVRDIMAQLKSENIQYYTPQNEQRLIEIIKGRCTFARLAGRADGENV